MEADCVPFIHIPNSPVPDSLPAALALLARPPRRYLRNVATLINPLAPLTILLHLATRISIFTTHLASPRLALLLPLPLHLATPLMHLTFDHPY